MHLMLLRWLSGSHASISDMIWRVVGFWLCWVDGGYTRRFESECWSTALVPLHWLENPWHATCHRLSTNAIWYDVSSTGPSLFLSVTHSFLSLCLYMSVCTSFHFKPFHPIPADSSSYFPSLLLFFTFLILILLSVFSEGGLTFVLLCNEQMPAVNVFLALCLWDSCQTQSKRGDTTSHYFIADDQQCVPWRFKKWNTEASLSLALFSLSLLISTLFLPILCVAMHVALYFSVTFSLLLIWCISISPLPLPLTQTHTHHHPYLSIIEVVCCRSLDTL